MTTGISLRRPTDTTTLSESRDYKTVLVKGQKVKHMLASLLLLLTTPAVADDMIKIAVIDTGFGTAAMKAKGFTSSHLCPKGHWNFVDGSSDVSDLNGHGTNIVGLIEREAGNAKYCLIILKFYSDTLSDQENLQNEAKAFKLALKLKVDFVNISGGGPSPYLTERNAIAKLIEKGTNIVAAAGNVKNDLDKECNFYPACYKKELTAKVVLTEPVKPVGSIVVVGNHNKDGSRAPTSNYGSIVTTWEIGQDQTAYGLTFSGTSQATAVVTGKLVKGFRKNRESVNRPR